MLDSRRHVGGGAILNLSLRRSPGQRLGLPVSLVDDPTDLLVRLAANLEQKQDLPAALVLLKLKKNLYYFWHNIVSQKNV